MALLVATVNSSGKNLLPVDIPKVNKLSKNFHSIFKVIKLILLIKSAGLYLKVKQFFGREMALAFVCVSKKIIGT